MTRTSIVVDGDRDRDSRGSRWNTKGKRTGEALGLQPAIESRMVIVGQHSKRPERQGGIGFLGEQADQMTKATEDGIKVG